MVFQIGEKLICANIGDSRAIIVKGNSSNELDIKPLSIDQKPDDPEETKELLKTEEKLPHWKKMGKNLVLLEFGKKEKYIQVCYVKKYWGLYCYYFGSSSRS